MPMFDKRCSGCNRTLIDVLEPIGAPVVDCECGGKLERAWLPGKASSVIGDEIDVLAKNGLCNPDGSPRRFTSRSEMRRVAASKGLTNYVEHRGLKGSDKSPHTSRWI